MIKINSPTEYYLGPHPYINGIYLPQDYDNPDDRIYPILLKRVSFKENLWSIFESNQRLNKDTYEFDYCRLPSNRDDNFGKLYHFDDINIAFEYWSLNYWKVFFNMISIEMPPLYYMEKDNNIWTKKKFLGDKFKTEEEMNLWIMKNKT